jgi:hypothetical protein
MFMKKITGFFLILFFGIVPFYAAAQRIQAIDWAVNPSYPVPHIYTANHMALNGKVKKLSDMRKSDFGTDIIILKYEFNPLGKLEKQIYSTNGKEGRVTTYKDTVYAYMPDGVTVREESVFKGDTTKSDISFFKKLLTTKTIYGEGAKLYQKTIVKYTHNDKGLLTEEDRLDMGTRSTKEKYTYSAAGQFTRSEHIVDYEVSSWKELSYEKEGDHLKITTWYRFKQGRDYKLVDTYDKNGLILKSTRESDKQELSYQYTFDANNNWTKRVQTTRNTETGTETVSTRFRTIEYYQ